MPVKDTCHNDDCREPHGQRFYVLDTNTNQVLCAPCWLVSRGVDDSDAQDITFEGERCRGF